MSKNGRRSTYILRDLSPFPVLPDDSLACGDECLCCPDILKELARSWKKI